MGIPTPTNASSPSVRSPSVLLVQSERGGVGFPTPPKDSFPSVQSQSGRSVLDERNSVGIPTLPAVWVFPLCSRWMSQFQVLATSSLRRIRFSRLLHFRTLPISTHVHWFFSPTVKNCRLDELVVFQLRTPGLTLHKHCTETLADHSLQKSFQLRENVASKRKSTTAQLNDPEHAPKVQEGAALLSDSPLVQVKEVDVSVLLLDKHRTWTPQAKELLSTLQHQKSNVFPPKGWPDLCLQTNKGPSPPWSKMYPYGFPCLSQHTKRVNDAVTTEIAFPPVLAFATVTQKNTLLVLFGSDERGKAHFGEPCSWWQTEDEGLLAVLEGLSTLVSLSNNGQTRAVSNRGLWA